MNTPRNWKSTLLLGSISALSLLLLCSALISTVKLPFLTRAGLFSWLVLLVLTVVASRFTVSITTNLGTHQSRKSVADALVFLAVILYAVPPADTAGPATLLAAIVAFVSTYGLASRRESIATTAIAIISTFLSASCYGFLATVFADDLSKSAAQGLPLSVFLVPLCVLAVLQYFFSTLATIHFLNLLDDSPRVLPSQESLVWTLTTQVAGAASAVLFYSALTGGGFAFILLGLLITAMVHLLYRFNEKRLNEVRRAEIENRKHVEEMATIHMNTIESLAIAIDAKDQTTHGHVRRTQIYASEMGKLCQGRRPGITGSVCRRFVARHRQTGRA